MDALAAQLVRRVDALSGVQVDSKQEYVVVWDFRPDRYREAALIKGPDRTLNTIRAIVDSGVLG